MKSFTAPTTARRATAPVPADPSVPATPDAILAPASKGAVRILLGIDIPAAVLPDIESDWAMITGALQDAPDLAPAMIAAALGRLQRTALGVSGVAVAEIEEKPFARWTHAA